MVIGYRTYRERFTSHVALERPRRIDVAYAQGPLRHLNNHWVFNRRQAAVASISMSISSLSRG